jgi:hypothetical protein
MLRISNPIAIFSPTTIESTSQALYNKSKFNLDGFLVNFSELLQAQKATKMMMTNESALFISLDSSFG